jgi:hypothetical protein
MKLSDKQQEMCITAVSEMVTFWNIQAKEGKGVIQEMADEQMASWLELLTALENG